MKCVICKYGETSHGTITITLERDGRTLVFKNVPAQICENCGESYVDEAITAQLLHSAETALTLGVQVEIREFQPI